MFTSRRGEPFVATKTSDCAFQRGFCGRPILRGEIVVRYEGASEGDDPHHVEHWIKELTDELARSEDRAERGHAVADAVLSFCGGLSAVSADWIEMQRRRLAYPR